MLHPLTPQLFEPHEKGYKSATCAAAETLIYFSEAVFKLNLLAHITVDLCSLSYFYRLFFSTVFTERSITQVTQTVPFRDTEMYNYIYFLQEAAALP